MTALTATAVTDGHPHEEGGTCACPNVGRMGPFFTLGGLGALTGAEL